MSSTLNSTGAGTLNKARGDLHWVLKTTEDSIATLVACFQGLARHADSTLSLAAAIVERVEDRSVSSVLSSVQCLGAAAREFVGDRLGATSGIIDTVTAEMELLRKLSMVTDGQANVAARIKMLNVHTKIEVAHLGKVGASFEYLAGELADFSKVLAKSTDELIRHTNERKSATEKTRQLFSVELPHLREELTQIEKNLSADLAALQSGLTQLSNAPVQFRASAEVISGQIAGVVVAVQGHDITRQQIEHVQEALNSISQAMEMDGASGKGKLQEVAYSHAGLAIQISQLKAIRATIADWTSRVRGCLGGILEISASGLAEIGPLVLEQERSMSAQLSHIELLERECLANSERIRGTLEGISNLSQLVSEHLQKSESARNRLRMLNYNSVIEASRLGAQADTICVIADGIAEVSVEWTKITEQSGSALREILSLSQRINEAMATFSQAKSESLGEAQAQTKAGLESLRDASTFAVAQGQKIGIETDAMQLMGSEAERTSGLLDSCYARIDAVLTLVEDAKSQLEAQYPDIVEYYDSERIERSFSATYTTEAERDVLRAALYGTEMPVLQQCAMGNDVELF
jgi:hypothetical protein